MKSIVMNFQMRLDRDLYILPNPAEIHRCRHGSRVESDPGLGLQVPKRKEEAQRDWTQAQEE